jgi:hypothetical protein
MAAATTQGTANASSRREPRACGNAAGNEVIAILDRNGWKDGVKTAS